MEPRDEIAQREDVQRRLKLASVLCLIFLIAELVGGIVSGSLAVLSDAAHLASDLMSFLFAVAAGHLASMSGSKRYTYGYRRWEVLAALFSMVSLAICSVFLTGEGVRRLLPYIMTRDGVDVEEVDGEVMSIIAFIGVVVNIALALVLGVENHVHMPGEDHNHDHNHAHGDVEEIVPETCVVVVKDKKGGKNKPAPFKFGDNQWHFGHGHDHSAHCHGVMACAPIAKEGKKKKTFVLPAPIEKDDDDDGGGDNRPLILPGDDLKKDETPKKPKENINLRAAYLHVLSDLAQSVAVFIAGVVIWYFPRWGIIDPILSIVFCPIIFCSTLGVIRSSINILLEGVPPEINLSDLRTSILAVEGVINVCDLHVWSISHGAVAMTLHATATDTRAALRTIHRFCTERYGIGHCTIQLEQDNGSLNCGVCGPGMAHCYNPDKPSGGEYELVEQEMV